MQAYTELLPPSGVTHALAIPFLSPTAENLIVVRTSLLQIFSLFNVTAPDSSAHSTKDKEVTKLELEAEYSLFGTVTHIGRVKALSTKSGGEALLLAFRNAKLSLIEWDPERHGISTISIHYYERDDLVSSPWVPDLNSCGSALSVDPGSRCAAFNFGVRNLAILPIHQTGDDLVIDEYESEVDGSKQGEAAGKTENIQDGGGAYQTPYGPSFVLPLTALDPSLLHPIGLAFLYEYREPTFGILYSQVASSHALLYERKDVVFYTVFTLDLEQRASTTLLSVSRLPSDLFQIVALPPPVGGALLVGSNELVHVDQAGKTNAVGVNEFSRQVSSFSMADRSDLALRLEGCIVERLDEDNGDVALVLASGDVAVVKFRLDGRSVTGMSVHIPPIHAGGKIMGSIASCSASLGSGRVFVGSEDSDSVLVEWSLVPSASSVRPRGKHVANDAVGVEITDGYVSEEEGYEDDLYSTPPQREPQPFEDGSASGMYSFQVIDRLPNIGPLRDVVLGKNHPPTGSKDSTVGELELVASQGSDACGGLVIMKREIEPHVAFRMEKMDTADSIWSMTVPRVPFNGAAGSVSFEQTEFRHYLIVAHSRHGGGRGDTDVFVVDGQALKPYRAPDFSPNADFSVDVGVLAGGDRVVQVLRGEIRSYDTGESEE